MDKSSKRELKRKQRYTYGYRLRGFKGASQDTIGKRATQLYLLAKRGDLEVIKQNIVENKLFSLKSGEDADLFEFVYILGGKIERTTDKRVLQEGDFLVVHGLGGEVYFRTLTPVSFLYVTNSPVFYDQKQAIGRLNHLLRTVEEWVLNFGDICLE